MVVRSICSALVLAVTMGCSGGSTNAAKEYTMKDIKFRNLSTVGTVGGFTYAAMQPVTVDITIPYPTGLISIYANHPAQSLYDASGAVAVTIDQLLAQGIATSGRYTQTISLPSGTSSVYLGAMMGLEPKGVEVPIVGGVARFSGFSVSSGGEL